MSSPPDPNAKVLFRVPNEDGTAEVETLWAYALGSDQYKLDNCPFYAYGVSLHDTVFAPLDADEGLPVFVRVISKSGNRTIRVVFDLPVAVGNESQRLLDETISLGCSYEGANPSYIVLNVPAEVQLSRVAETLIKSGVTWEHADPTHEELHRDGA